MHCSMTENTSVNVSEAWKVSSLGWGKKNAKHASPPRTLILSDCFILWLITEQMDGQSGCHYRYCLVKSKSR